MINGYQVLDSIEADFEKMTWTFQITPSNRVAAGEYVIIDVAPFMKLNERMERAEHLLRVLRDDRGLDGCNKERIDSFFDPEPEF